MSCSVEETTTAYIYEPLRGPRNIRILILQPHSLDPDALISLSFEQADCSELAGAYEALSYVWGKPALTHIVHVDGNTHIHITANLDSALRRLRDPHHERRLWADAICINQQDKDEKAVQIPLMRQIYRGARRVLAWLGPGHTELDDNEGVALLERLSRQGRTFNTRERRSDPADPMLTKSIHPMSQRALIRLLSVPWFKRLWIIQEIVLNADVDLVYGTSEISWLRFFVGLMNAKRTISLSLPAVQNATIDAVLKIAELWMYHQSLDHLATGLKEFDQLPAPDKILGLMETFHDYKCGDDRDRIYALSGMTDEIQPPSSDVRHGIIFEVNYSLNVAQTYKNFASACIRAGDIEAILSAVLSRQYSPRSEYWPSWVPDWRKRCEKVTFVPSNYCHVTVDGEHLFISRLPRGNSIGRVTEIVSMAEQTDLDKTLHSLIDKISTLSNLLTGSSFVQELEEVRILQTLKSMLMRCSHIDPVLLKKVTLNQPYSTRNSLAEDASSDPDWSMLQGQLLEAMKYDCFFTAEGLGSSEVPGYGNVAIERGDFLLSPQDARPPFTKCTAVWILREAGMVKAPDGKYLSSYRLIGSARIYGLLPMYKATERRICLV